MNGTTDRRATSLRSRLLVGGALLIALPVLSAIAATWLVGERIANAEVAASLSRSKAAEERVWRERAERLRLVCRMLAADPAFGGYVAEVAALPDEESGLGRRSLLDLLDERRAVNDFDVAIVLDEAGRVLARSDAPGEFGAEPDDPLVRRAVDGLVETTGLRVQDGRLLQVAIAPVTSEYTLAGFLLLGLEVDDAVAADVGDVGGAELVVLGRSGAGAGDGARVLASSLDDAATAALRDALHDAGISIEHERPDQRFELAFQGRRVVVRVDPLRNGDDPAVGATLAVTSVDRELEPFRAIRRVVLLSGAVALLAGLALSVVLTRRLVGPLRALALAADAAASGDYEHPIETRGDAEVRTLARSIARLLGDLRERREMAEYVREISRHVAEPPPVAPRPRPLAPRIDSDAPTLAPEADDAEGGVEGAPRPGSVWAGRYEVLSRLGQGGMGVVVLATDRELGETVALKTLRPEIAGGAQGLERMKDELRLARKVTHRNVLRTFDFGVWQGVPYLSMEYVRGINLHELLRRVGRLPESVACFLGRHLCDGLEAAHAQGVLHRDIKPANVIVDAGGRALLMDFGIAQPVAEVGPGQPGTAGTPVYMAPELFAGSPASERSDVYSMGVLLIEVVTGRRPFRQTSLEALVAAKRRPLAPLVETVTELSRDADIVLRRCVDPEPDRRFAGAAELRAAFEELRS